MAAGLHRWDVTPKEGIEIQKTLAGNVSVSGGPDAIRYIAGVDIAFHRKESAGYCGIIVFSYPELIPAAESFYSDVLTFPYVPGLLSFREGPLFLETWDLLKIRPDVIIFDGQGIAHPRKLGIASHMGLWLGIPTIGCAKSRLYGTYEEPASVKGSVSSLYDSSGAVIGTVIRTKNGVKPVFVSPGHMIGIDESVEIILRCTGKYRIPIPTREAHIRVGDFKRRMMENGIPPSS